MKIKTLTALVIDDSEIIRERLVEMLNEVKGVRRVEGAACAKEGLRLANSIKPGLIVLDLRMPEMNGMDILPELKKNIQSPLIIILTNFPYPSYRKYCLNHGADYFLDKASEFSEIKGIVLDFLHNGKQEMGRRSEMKAEKIKILLVEDNDMNRDMLSRRLSRVGFKIIVAVNGLEALEQTMEENPDLILMDMSLPELDGWETTRRLKGDKSTQHIPIIALTAHALKSDRQGALEAGCNDFDIKPIDFPRLMEKIEGQLHREELSHQQLLL
jgi:CheY-like chemotaxis protein